MNFSMPSEAEIKKDVGKYFETSDKTIKSIFSQLTPEYTYKFLALISVLLCLGFFAVIIIFLFKYPDLVKELVTSLIAAVGGGVVGGTAGGYYGAKKAAK